MHETFNFGKKVRYLPGSLNNGNIAQLVEQGAVNSQVVGSEPTIPAKFGVTVHFQYFIMGLHVPRLAFLPCKERVEGSIPFGSTNFDVKVIPGLIQRYNLYIKSWGGGAIG